MFQKPISVPFDKHRPLDAIVKFVQEFILSKQSITKKK